MDEYEQIQNEFLEMRDSAEESNLLKEIKCLESIIYKARELQQRIPGRSISFNHVVEIPYYEFFTGDVAYQCAKTSLNRMYNRLAELFHRCGNLNSEKKALQSALHWNPVDLDAYFALAEGYKQDGDLEKCLEISNKAHPYCNTRAALSRYYRNLGYYYLENYQPELSAALYQYSEIYYKTGSAKGELEYLAKAMKRDLRIHDRNRLQMFLKDNSIPLGFNKYTTALTYQAYLMEKQRGHIGEAGECYELYKDQTAVL